jgi:hypothetical protein
MKSSVALSRLIDWALLKMHLMPKFGRPASSGESLLITGNRNAQGEESLEMNIRENRTSDSLPVFTISDPNRIMRDREYAERVAARLIEFLTDLDRLAGSGRLYLP